MSTPPLPPFDRTDAVFTADLVGARWWQERLATSTDPVARRAALIVLGATTAVVIGAGVVAVAAASGSSSPSPLTGGSPLLGDDLQSIQKKSLDAQRELGWNVGAGSSDLVFDGATTESLDAGALDHLEQLLAPENPTLTPYYVPTLFQSLNALPTGTPIDSDPMKKLRDTIKPVRTAAMTTARGQGSGFAELFTSAPAGKAVMVDLPGPLAVAFAAGLAEKLDPVFELDGWPHPQGVVPSHLTLAAAATYLTVFEDAARARSRQAPPAFILDRNRLTPYTSDSDRFDNRYTARVPTAQNLTALGIKQLFYVSENAAQEPDDLNDDFVAYKQAGIEIRRIAPGDFVESNLPPQNAANLGSTGTTGSYQSQPHYYWGGGPTYHWYFWNHYGWGAPRYTSVAPIYTAPMRSTYVPTTRSTMFSGRARPAGFGSVGLFSAAGGRTVGTSRSGSWGRSGFSSGGS